MKKSLVVVIVLVVVVIVAGGVYFLTRGDGNKTNNTGQNPQTSSESDMSGMNEQEMKNMDNNSSDSDTSKAVQTDSVTIKDMAYTPANITVKKGTTVTWTNNDSTTHTVTKDGANGPDSGNLASGQSYSFTFDTVGKFTYHCTFHPFMTGSVTVTE